MRRHPEIGARILAADEFDDIREWVHAHHERPDGRGYPDGLQGEEIAEGPSLLGLADAWDAMTSERTYSGPRSAEEALAECRDAAGTQFAPPHAVAALETLWAAGLAGR